MSCCLVSDTLISALVTAAAKYDNHSQLTGPNWGALYRDHPEAFARLGGSLGGHVPSHSNLCKTYPDEVGRALALLNFQSFHANYAGRHTKPNDLPEALAYQFEETTLEVVSLIKQVHYYAYQSSEAPDWDSSWAKVFCERLESILIQSLPGYQAAPWGV